MDRTLTNWRRVLAASLLAGASSTLGAAAQEQPAAAGSSKFKVLVPALEERAGARGNFGKDVAKELRKLIERMPRHEPIPEKEMKDAYKKFGLKEDEVTCVQNRQLAVSLDTELVMCGNFSGGDNNFRVDSIQFINAKTQEAFEVQTVTAPSPREAATQIFNQFQGFVGFIERLAYCYQYIESQQWAQAIENCDAALAVNPNSPRANMGKAFAIYSQAGSGDQTDQNKLRESLALYQKVLQNNLEQEALRTAGIIAARLGLNEESRNYFRQYLELNPGDAAVRLTIANEQAKAGDHEGALRIVEEGLKADSANVDLLTWAGVYAAQAGFKIHSEAPPATQASEIPPGAKTLYEVAVGYYNRLYQLKQGDMEPSIAEQLIKTLVVLERFNEAVDVGRTLAPSKAGTAAVLAAYAAALGNAGNNAEAIRVFDQAIAKGDTAVKGLHGRKADLLIRSGDLEAAKTAFRETITAGEKTSDEIAGEILRVALNEKFTKKEWEGFSQYVEAAREFAQDATRKSELSFWTGMMYQSRAAALGQPTKLADAKAALPLWQRALDHLQDGAAFGRSNPSYNYAQTLSQVREYITYLQEVIKRGI